MTGICAIIVGVVGAVISGFYLLLSVLDRNEALVDARLRELSPRSTAVGAGSSRRSSATAGQRRRSDQDFWSACNRLIPNSDLDRQRHRSRLAHAGLYHPTALSAFFIARLACMLGPLTGALLAGYFGLLDYRLGLVVGSILGTVGMILPSFWLDRRIARRQATLRRALPDYLDLMIVCLEGGLSLQGTIQRVSDEMQIAHPVLAEESRIVQRDIELGTSIDASFAHFAERSGLDVIRTLSTFFREARRFGSEMAEALRSYTENLRFQREQAAEEMAQKASIKILFPTLLLILPAVFVVLAGPAAIKIQQAFSK